MLNCVNINVHKTMVSKVMKNINSKFTILTSYSSKERSSLWGKFLTVAGHSNQLNILKVLLGISDWSVVFFGEQWNWSNWNIVKK